MIGMKNSQMGHGSSVAQRSWPLVTRAMAALLTFAASFGAGSFAAVASDQAGRGEMAPHDCWQPESTVKGCAVTGQDGQLHLTPLFRANLQFDSDGLTAVLLLGRSKGEAGRWLY